jgi:hypothetical protein
MAFRQCSTLHDGSPESEVAEGTGEADDNPRECHQPEVSRRQQSREQHAYRELTNGCNR